MLFSLTPIVINAWIGVKGVPKTLVEVGHSFVASEPFIMRHIVLPYALPSIIAGCGWGSGGRSSPWRWPSCSPP